MATHMGSRPERKGFTLIELLVVIAIIGVLIGLLLPAVQKVRAAAARAACTNNLKQWGVAAHNYHGVFNTFPPGINDGSKPNAMEPTRRYNWIIALMPYVEQDAVQKQWNFDSTNFNANAVAPDGTVGGPNAPIALIFKIMTCPSDIGLPNPPRDTTQQPPLQWALTTYVGCVGTNASGRSTPGGATDGIWTYNQKQPYTRLADVVDGTSNTLLFGERDHLDDIYSNDPFVNDKIWYWGWAYYSSNILDVMLVTSVPINFKLPQNFASLDSATKNLLKGQRRTNFGSMHGGGANFTLADGSVRFISENISPITFQAMGTRAGGETVAGNF